MLRQQLHDAFRPALGLCHEHLGIVPFPSPADLGDPVAEPPAEPRRRLARDVPRGVPRRDGAFRRRAVGPRLVDGQRAERRRLGEPAGGSGPFHLEVPGGGAPRRRARGRRPGSRAAVPPTAGGSPRCRAAQRRGSAHRRAGRSPGTRRSDPPSLRRRRTARTDRAGAPPRPGRAPRRSAGWPDRNGAATRCCRPRTPPARGRRRRPGRGRRRRLRGRRTLRASRPDRRDGIRRPRADRPDPPGVSVPATSSSTIAWSRRSGGLRRGRIPGADATTTRARPPARAARARARADRMPMCGAMPRYGSTSREGNGRMPRSRSASPSPSRARRWNCASAVIASTSESRGTTSTTGPVPASTAAASACAGGDTPASDSPRPGGPAASPARCAASCSRVPSVSDPVIDGTLVRNGRRRVRAAARSARSG